MGRLSDGGPEVQNAPPKYESTPPKQDDLLTSPQYKDTLPQMGDDITFKTVAREVEVTVSGASATQYGTELICF